MESIQTKYDWQPIIIDQWEHQIPLAAAWNEGIIKARMAHCDFTLISNDDVLYSPWTIDALVEELLSASNNIVMVTGCNNRGIMPVPQLIRHIDKPENPTKAEHPDFSCFMIRKNFTDVVGTFDENLFPAYYEDNEMHIRINILGYKAITTTAAPYYHYGSATQNAILDPEKVAAKHAAFQANNKYLVDKWGTTNAAGLVYRHPFNNVENDPKIWKKEWRSE